MQATKAIAAICLALLLGMIVSTFIPGCQPSAPPAPAPAPPPTTPSGSSTTTDDGPPPGHGVSTPIEDAPASTKPGVVTAAEAVAKGQALLPPGDYTQWGGSPMRNNTPTARGILTDWDPGKFDRRTGAWSGGRNVRWVAQLGSQSYGNTVVAAGKVFLGTNNSAGYLKRYPDNIDLGVLVCFNEKDGKFLWQHSSEKLDTGRVHDWMFMGICCSPLVEGDRLWFVTSRGEVKCLDAQGYYDGEDDGPVTSEPAKLFTVRRADDPADDKVGGYVQDLDNGKLPADLVASFEGAGMKLPAGEIAVKTDKKAPAPLKKWTFQAQSGGADRDFYLELRGPNLHAFKIVTPADKEEADVVWSFNMMDKLGSSQHNMCSCSVTALGDILFVNTSNGVDDSHLVVSAPNAPSFVAMDKNTGEVFWTDNSPGKNILHGQWSSPAVATIGGVPQVMFGGGDGWLYSFKADKGTNGKPELLWRFDANDKDAQLVLGATGTRNDIISTPVVYDNKVYFCTGQDPEHGEGDGIFWCLDPTKRGDISEMLAVNRADPKTPIPIKREQAVVEADGDMAVPNPNSGVVWKYVGTGDINGNKKLDFEEIFHRSIGTAVIKDDLLFIADFSGCFHCLDAQTGKAQWTYDMLAASWGSGMIVGDKVYHGDEDGDVIVFNLTRQKHGPVAEINMGNAVYSTPVVANGVLYIASNDRIFAIAPTGASSGGE